MAGGKLMDPGVAVVRTWQGVVEIVLRTTAIVSRHTPMCGAGTLATALDSE